MTTADQLSELIPSLFTGLVGEPFTEHELVFEPLVTDGRTSVEIHRLYTTAETGEQGPAAAIVRYLPGGTAKPHLHPGYELIYVISGELETDDGVYGPNSLLMMRPGSVHAPRSPHGCVGLAVWERPVQPA